MTHFCSGTWKLEPPWIFARKKYQSKYKGSFINYEDNTRWIDGPKRPISLQVQGEKCPRRLSKKRTNLCSHSDWMTPKYDEISSLLCCCWIKGTRSGLFLTATVSPVEVEAELRRPPEEPRRLWSLPCRWWSMTMSEAVELLWSMSSSSMVVTTTLLPPWLPLPLPATPPLPSPPPAAAVRHPPPLIRPLDLD